MENYKLIRFRDILGHISVQTTEVYTRANSHAKREAIEKTYASVVPSTDPSWLSNNDLLEWLKHF